VSSSSTVAEQARSVGARVLALAGDVALQASRRLMEGDSQGSLRGDRWIEWSFCLARLADGPGTTLDFGSDTGFLALGAAQRGHDVVALDRLPPSLDYRHERVNPVQADILDHPLSDRRFDQIVNCSSVEHVGLAGRYGSGDEPEGDLAAMAILRDMLQRDGRMILTIPVGQDLLCPPLHRIYGPRRLPALLDSYHIDEEQYWHRDRGARAWMRADRDLALETVGSRAFYSLGLFVLRPNA
jgi:SAM-dependent methyltransferase